MTVTIKDIGGATTTVNNTAAVADAKLTSQGALIQAVEGITTGNILVATFTDANPMSTLSDFTTGNGSITVNWGDGTPLYTVPPANITSVGSPTGVTYQVFAAHTYAETGSYQTIVTIKDTGGSATVANGEADVADAPLTTTGITQPTVTTDEAVIYPIPEFGTPLFTGSVASFNDTNPLGTVSDFRATIDWGDGSPRSTGTISQPGLPGTPFFVTGSHTYATSGVNGGVGHDTITVLITDEDGATLTVSNTANVQDNPIQVAGILNPSSDSGKSATDFKTKVSQPNFYGTVLATLPNGTQVAEPYANVTLFANGVQVGHTEAGSDGSWSITSNKLAQGTYAITAQAIDQFGQTTSPVKTLVQNLVVDTAPPVITSLSFNRLNGTLTVVFKDNLSGMNLKSITNSAFYHISATPLTSNVHPPKLILPTSISYTPGVLPSDPVVVHVVFNKGHSMRGGNYAVIINSGTGDKGIQDVAGNALDGNYYGKFPSGDGLAGGNFVATIATFHNRVLPGIPILDGYVPPSSAVDPPAGSSKTGTTKKVVTTHNTAQVKAPVSRPVVNTSVHDKALLAIIAELKPSRLASIEAMVAKSGPTQYTQIKAAIALMNSKKN